MSNQRQTSNWVDRIPFFDLKRQYADLKKEIAPAIESVIEKNEDGDPSAIPKESETVFNAGNCMMLKGKFSDRNGEASFVVEKAKAL